MTDAAPSPLPLVAAHPALARLPHLPLGRFPTPVERAGALAASAGLADLWVKRDDVSADPYGGNKVRKLEWLLADARARAHDRVLTMGAFGSHHVLATAIFGAANGFAVEAVVFPQPLNAHVLDDLHCILAAGARLHPIAHKYLLPFAVARRRLQRPRCYFIAGGGSSPVGALGYVNAAYELAAQVAAGALPAPAAIFVACGSAGTQAGLALGVRLAGLDTRVVGVRVADAIVTNRRHIAGLAARTARLMARAGCTIPPAAVPAARDVELDTDFFGPGYGHDTPAARDACARAADLAGLTLETTYTAKALAALLATARARVGDRAPVLFWNTFSSRPLETWRARTLSRGGVSRRLLRLVGA